MTILSVTGAAVRFGGVPLFEDVGLQVEAGERWGIIGRNGSGKTTLMELILGHRNPDSGSLARSSGLRIAVMDQYRDFGNAATVWEAAARGFAELFALEHALQVQLDAMSAAGDSVTQAMLDRYAHDLERFEHAGGYAASSRVDAVLAGLGFDPVAARTRPIEALSGGERGRLALAGQLAAPADLLILDEPTNHLDIATARWLEGYLRDLDEAVKAACAFVDTPGDDIDWGNTLLVVTADHANSYMRLSDDIRLGQGDLPEQVAIAKDDKAWEFRFRYPGGEVSYQTKDHTNEPVMLYAKGEAASLFRLFEGTWYPG
ncbi:MAG: hypothetical protein CVV20_05970, partial [Gemmatimonadetes bacterium HGW-Gemmatimonadetes-1]